jgi:uncharacterized protein with GYD domain
MAKFLLQASYTAEGLKGLMKDKGSGRRAAVEAAVKSVGGTIESIYFTFGSDDVILIMDMPDNATAAAMSLAAAASGAVRTRTTPLLTVEDVDRALSMKTKYKAPGK